MYRSLGMFTLKWPIPAGIRNEGLFSNKLISISVLSAIYTVILPLPDVASVTIVTFRGSLKWPKIAVTEIGPPGT